MPDGGGNSQYEQIQAINAALSAQPRQINALRGQVPVPSPSHGPAVTSPTGPSSNSFVTLQQLLGGDAGESGGPNPSGGQPGSAGQPGLAKSAADALMGLAMGFGPLGIAGSLLGTIGQQASNSPSLLGSLLGGLFGPDASSALGSAGMSAGTNPGISGSTGFSGSASTAATGDTAGDVGNTRSGIGSGTGQGSSGTGVGPGGSGPGGPGIGSGSDNGGDNGGYAMGGIVRGPVPMSPWRDNMLKPVQAGEAILPRGMVNQLGQSNIMNMIRRYRQTGANPIGRSVMLSNPGVQHILGR